VNYPATAFRRSPGFLSREFIKINHFFEKTLREENVIDCYYTSDRTLHVISVDLENKVIIDSIEISENSWAICIDEEMFFHV